MRGQHLLDGFPLRGIQKFAAVRMGCSLFFGQNWLNGILAALHVRDGRQFRSDCVASGELPPGFVLLPVNGLELAAAVSLVKVRPNLVIGEVAHAAPQGVPHDVPLVGNGLTLEAAILGKADCFLRPLGRIRHPVLRHSFGPFSRRRDDVIGLVAELGRNLPVSGEHLSGRMDFLPVAGVMGGDLRGLGPAEAAPRDGFFDLLAARAGRFKVLGGVAFHIGSAALARFDLVAEIAEPEGQLRLVDSGRKLLGIEESALLQCAN